MPDESPLPLDLETWTVPVGRIRGRWDRTDLKIQSFSDHGEHFAAGRQLCAEKGGVRRLLTIVASRPKDHGWICRCGIAELTEADALVGSAVTIHPSQRVPLEPGQFYLDELCGFTVVTEAGETWGEVEEVMETPAHLVFATPEAMIPDHPDFVVRVEGESRRIVVRDLPGLRTAS